MSDDGGGVAGAFGDCWDSLEFERDVGRLTRQAEGIEKIRDSDRWESGEEKKPYLVKKKASRQMLSSEQIKTKQAPTYPVWSS